MGRIDLTEVRVKSKNIGRNSDNGPRSRETVRGLKGSMDRVGLPRGNLIGKGYSMAFHRGKSQSEITL